MMYSFSLAKFLSLLRVFFNKVIMNHILHIKSFSNDCFVTLNHFIVLYDTLSKIFKIIV